MQKTNIEYLTHTWNPIAMRCTPVSSGCNHCWHLRMAKRLRGAYDSLNPEFRNQSLTAAYAGFSTELKVGELSAPLRRKKPSVIGVQFMGDLFYGKVANGMMAAVFGVMAACPQHTFAVLTKRPERALNWFESHGRVFPGIENHACRSQSFGAGVNVDAKTDVSTEWPLPNVWFGVSIEDFRFHPRADMLRKIPAAKRFISFEPCLGPATVNFDSIDWLICGAETGPGKRPMDLDWARSLRDQCSAASVPFFFKKDSDGNHTLDGVVHEELL